MLPVKPPPIPYQALGTVSDISTERALGEAVLNMRRARENMQAVRIAPRSRRIHPAPHFAAYLLRAALQARRIPGPLTPLLTPPEIFSTSARSA